MSTAASESRSASSWSPSTPKARMARSMSPTRVNTSSMSAELCSVSKASKVIVSTRSAPRSRSSAASGASDAVLRAASTIVRARRATSARKVACAMSEPAPSTSTDCTEPNESCMVPFSVRNGPGRGSGQAEAPTEVGLEDPGGVDPGAELGEPGQIGVHHTEELGPEPGVLRQVHATTDTGDELVEVVEQRGEPGHDRGDVERERPPRRGEGERPGVLRAEALEHGEERRRVRVTQHLDRAPHRFVRVVGHDVLVLQEPTVAVEAVPVAHAVERVEEGRDGLELPVQLRRH